MSFNDDACPICFRDYGFQPDGSFLVKDSPNRLANFHDGFKSNDECIKCNHWVCIDCVKEQFNNSRSQEQPTRICCPICRVDWTNFVYMRAKEERWNKKQKIFRNVIDIEIQGYHHIVELKSIKPFNMSRYELSEIVFRVIRQTLENRDIMLEH